MNFDRQLYESGLTAQGSYDKMDQYDQEAIIRFAELIIQESIKVMKDHDYHGEWLGEKVKEHFGFE
jgi:hypothetical protein